MIDLAVIRELVRSAEWNTLGVPVTVGSTDTQGIWLTYQPEELPSASSFHRSAPRKVMALRKDEVATVPLGTVVQAPDIIGGSVQSWVVDGYLEERDDHHRVILIETT